MKKYIGFLVLVLSCQDAKDVKYYVAGTEANLLGISFPKDKNKGKIPEDKEVSPKDIEINHTDKSVFVELPYGSKKTIFPVFHISSKARVVPKVVKAIDFSSPKIFTFVSEDNITKNKYEIVVRIGKSSVGYLKSYSILMSENKNLQEYYNKYKDKLNLKTGNIIGSIDQNTDVVTLKFPHSSLLDRSSLKPTLSIEDKFAKNQYPKDKLFDYENNDRLIFRIISDNGTMRMYTVSIQELNDHRSNQNVIKKIVFKSSDNPKMLRNTNTKLKEIVGIVDNEHSRIVFNFPFKSDLLNLKAQIDISDKATVFPASGTKIRFLNSILKFIVSSESELEKKYNLEINIAPDSRSNEAMFQSYKLLKSEHSGRLASKFIENEYNAVIDQNSLTLDLDYQLYDYMKSYLPKLKPTYVLKGKAVAMKDSVTLKKGINYFEPGEVLIHKLISENEKEHSFEVIINRKDMRNKENKILTYKIEVARNPNKGFQEDIEGNIVEFNESGEISITVPFAFNLTGITPTVTISPAATLFLNIVTDDETETVVNYTLNLVNPLKHRVDAESDILKRVYTIKMNRVSASIQRDITAIKFIDAGVTEVIGTIDESASPSTITFSVPKPIYESTAKRHCIITHSKFSTVKVNSVTYTPNNFRCNFQTGHNQLSIEVYSQNDKIIVPPIDFKAYRVIYNKQP